MFYFVMFAIIGLVLEVLGAILIAMPILQNSKWNLDYLKILKQQNLETLTYIKTNTGTITNNSLAIKILEDENKFIERIENSEKDKIHDKRISICGIVLLVVGFGIQTTLIVHTV